ncbi:glycosyltransferase family 2 protein [Mangrovimonas futianensis]|uniref:glycosyltransferase family 2 protein n=1 Tax=Mangrovimonas futianensis TaxID=2895523 RepID=UPI001E4A62A1|nr:glycosyltransferase family 2 protein [Mangrovimonas futianensis]MCF1420139.1 glycosyltransferase family 2 protein [Mangrovimonas futianensis]
MNFYIVIPAHNEADSIGDTLNSLVHQTLLPKKIVVVNDHSSDDTPNIVEEFSKSHNFIELVTVTSSNEHLPGTKIINAFYKGYDTLDEAYDVICKYDADLIFPLNYLESLANHFKESPKLGMAAGVCYIENNGQWVLEDLTGKDHIRGALKAYRKDCFLEIGKLKRTMGWDTIDELLAKFYGWNFFADDTLHVKHLKPTGASYNKAAKHLQGEAMYKMRYGLILTTISALKLSVKKKSFNYFRDYIAGYLKALKEKPEFTVTSEEGKYIRNYRWKGILKKLY